MSKLLRWKRGSDNYLFLQVLQINSEGKPAWVHYTQAIHKKPDYSTPGIRNSKGFATAQEYLKRGYSYVKFEENYDD